MGSVNKVIIVGNLGRDAELRYTPGGTAVAKFSIATSEVWTDKSGQKQERTEWHSIDLWGKQAESLNEYLRKGKQIYCEGRLQTDEYTDKEGVKRKATKVRADRVVLLSSGSSRIESPAEQSHALPVDDPAPVSVPVTEDDIPF
jgi:single-strand DNA-binding protein